MSSPGRIPKRSEDLTRRNTPESEGKIPLSKGERVPFKVPPADSKWAPRAKQWYRSLSRSGMNGYYQLSDYETARIICDALTDYYKHPTAMMLATILQSMNSLGVTEGERRRMRIELEEAKVAEVPRSVTALNDYRNKLGVQET